MEGEIQFQKTEALILRKTEYSESSLISTALTADLGQQDLIFKGVRKSGKKLFPVVDLFRKLRIIYKPSSRSNLITIRDAEILQAHDRIALIRDNFRFAIWLNQFVLKNTKPNIGVPNMYQALDVAYRRLCSTSSVSITPLMIAFCFVTFSDNGCLPTHLMEASSSGFDQILDFALNSSTPVPAYSESGWRGLADWTQKFIMEYTDLILPGGSLIQI